VGIEAAFIREDIGRAIEKRQSWHGSELEQAPEHGLPNEVHARPERVETVGDGKVVLKLPFFLNGLLRDVAVGAEVAAVRENGSERRELVGADYVVPILIAGRGVVDDRGSENGVQREIGKDQMVGGEVPGCQ